MANWVKCTLLSGDEVFLNFDNAVYIHRNVKASSTQVDLMGETHTIVIRETVDELGKLGVTFSNAP